MEEHCSIITTLKLITLKNENLHINLSQKNTLFHLTYNHFLKQKLQKKLRTFKRLFLLIFMRQCINRIQDLHFVPS